MIVIIVIINKYNLTKKLIFFKGFFALSPKKELILLASNPRGFGPFKRDNLCKRFSPRDINYIHA